MSHSSDQDALADVAVKDGDGGIREIAATRLTSAGSLARVAREAKDEKLRLEATNRVDDQAVLAQVARNDAAASVRRMAIGRLTDGDAIAELAVRDTDVGVRAAAVERLRLSAQNDATLLARVARVTGDAKVRSAIASKISAEVAAQFAVWQNANPSRTGADLAAQLTGATGIKLVRIAPGNSRWVTVALAQHTG